MTAVSLPCKWTASFPALAASTPHYSPWAWACRMQQKLLRLIPSLAFTSVQLEHWSAWFAFECLALVISGLFLLLDWIAFSHPRNIKLTSKNSFRSTTCWPLLVPRCLPPVYVHVLDPWYSPTPILTIIVGSAVRIVVSEPSYTHVSGKGSIVASPWYTLEWSGLHLSLPLLGRGEEGGEGVLHEARHQKRLC